MQRFKFLLRAPSNRYEVFMFVAVAVLFIDAGFIAHHIRTDQHQQKFITSQLTKLGSNVPSSVKPTAKAVASYQVPPANPKYLIIPKLQISARVIKISVNPQNQILAPSTIYDVGWYNGSSLPGTPGAMFIDGHVSSWTAKGIFYSLNKLKAGDTIQIVRGDNKTFTYVVNQLKTYDANNVDMAQALAPISPGTAGLNLMTCTGQVIKGTSEFNQRLVVYSTLQS